MLKPLLKCMIWMHYQQVVRKVKKAVSTRWLSLHASVNGVYDEFVGLSETLNFLVEEKGSGSAMTKVFFKKIEKLKFSWNALYIKSNAVIINCVKHFSLWSHRFFKNCSKHLKTKTKLQQLFDNDTVNLLKDDLQTRLRSCHFQINEKKEGIITDTAERYVKAN